MLMEVNEYLAMLKGMLKYELENNPPEMHDAIRKMREKHIVELEEIIKEAK
jgi:hypothetical protein